MMRVYLIPDELITAVIYYLRLCVTHVKVLLDWRIAILLFCTLSSCAFRGKHGRYSGGVLDFDLVDLVRPLPLFGGCD